MLVSDESIPKAVSQYLQTHQQPGAVTVRSFYHAVGGAQHHSSPWPVPERPLHQCLSFIHKQLRNNMSRNSNSVGSSDSGRHNVVETTLTTGIAPMMLFSSHAHDLGLVLALIKRMQGWSLTASVEQYRMLVGPGRGKMSYELMVEAFDFDLVIRE